MTNITPEEMDAYTEQVLSSLRKLMADMSHRMSETFAGSALSHPHCVILLELRESGEATMGELASALWMSPSMVSRLVDHLVEKGFIKRHRPRDDRRVVVVQLSRKGKNYADKIISIFEEEMKAILARFQKEEASGFIEFLQELDRRLS